MNYQTIQVHPVRKQKKGGVSLYIQQSIEFKIQNNLSINSDGVKSISVELLFDRQPKGQMEPFEKFLKETFSQIKSNFMLQVISTSAFLIMIYLKKQEFLNIIYENGMIPIINKPTRVTNKTATAMNHILTNSYTETIFKTAILKCDVSDHFPICLIIPSLRVSLKNKIIYTYKRSFNEQSIFNFKKKLFQID